MQKNARTLSSFEKNVCPTLPLDHRTLYITIYIYFQTKEKEDHPATFIGNAKPELTRYGAELLGLLWLQLL